MEEAPVKVRLAGWQGEGKRPRVRGVRGGMRKGSTACTRWGRESVVEERERQKKRSWKGGVVGESAGNGEAFLHVLGDPAEACFGIRGVSSSSCPAPCSPRDGTHPLRIPGA